MHIKMPAKVITIIIPYYNHYIQHRDVFLYPTPQIRDCGHLRSPTNYWGPKCSQAPGNWLEIGTWTQNVGPSSRVILSELESVQRAPHL